MRILEENPPKDLFSADIFRNNDNIYLRSVTLLLGLKDVILSHETSNLFTDKWSNEYLITCSSREEAVAKALIDGTALAVSDGLFKKDRATSAAIIED